LAQDRGYWRVVVKTDAVYFSKTLVCACKSRWHYRRPTSAHSLTVKPVILAACSALTICKHIITELRQQKESNLPAYLLSTSLCFLSVCVPLSTCVNTLHAVMTRDSRSPCKFLPQRVLEVTMLTKRCVALRQGQRPFKT
jgi:hypothetical protein